MDRSDLNHVDSVNLLQSSSYSSSLVIFPTPTPCLSCPHPPPHHLVIGTYPYIQSNLNAEWHEANDALSKSEGRRRKLLLVLLQAKRFLAHAVTHSPDMFMGVIWNIDRDFKTAIVGIPKQRKQTGMVIRKEFEAELEYAFVRALCCL